MQNDIYLNRLSVMTVLHVFLPTKKFGFFPSVAAGWRISEEQFIKENEQLHWLSGLKIKASWGRLGNQDITNYPYQTVYELGSKLFIRRNRISGRSCYKSD